MKMDNEQREGTVMLIKAIIGAAALVFPRCYQRAGIIPATLALIVAGWAGVVVGDLLMETRRALGPRVSSFRDMGIAATGGSRWGGVVLDATVTLQSFGTLVGYVVAVGDLVSSSLHKVWNVPDLIELPTFLSNMLFMSSTGSNIKHVITVRSFSLIVLTLFVFFPLCLLRRLESLRALAASTMVIYCIFLLVLFKESAARIIAGDFQFGGEQDLIMPSAPLNWMNGGIGNLFRVLPIIALSYSCVPLMIEVRRTLERRLPSRQQVESSWRVVSMTSFAASGFFYIATGFLGYVAFRGSTNANVLSNLEDLGWIATMVNGLFAASLIVSYPLICFVVREPVRRVLYWVVLVVFNKDVAEETTTETSMSSQADPERGSAAQKLDTSDLSAALKDDDDSPDTPTNAGSARPSEHTPWLLFSLEAAIVTSATLAAAIAVPGIDVVLELIGGTAAVFVSYVAPVGLFFLVKPESSYRKDWLKALMIGVVGIWIGILTCWNLYVSLSGRGAASASTSSNTVQVRPPQH